MTVQVKDLSNDHKLVLAGYAMVQAHQENETIIPALDQVYGEFPELNDELLIALWVGINCKVNEG